MFSILVLGPYPNSVTIRDGYFQRIKSLDEQIEEKSRTYVAVRFRKNFTKREEKLAPGLVVLHLNLYIHFGLILQLFRQADTIIAPSVNCMRLFIWAFIWSGTTRNKNIIYDIHGVVPEEQAYKGRRLRSIYLSLLEWMLFRWARSCLFVTNTMREYYLKKYPFIAQKRLVVYPNVYGLKFSMGHYEKKDGPDLPPVADKHHTTFIYSGNIQMWQNVPKMLTTIKDLVDNPAYEFIILTMKLKEFEALLDQYNITGVTLKSVSPHELADYYNKAHYGFVLRDDHVVNHVACPTKLMEYLSYGLIPIVASENIGDFIDLGYEYVHIEELDDSMRPRKSAKNQEIVQRIMAQAQSFNLNDYL